VFGMNACGLRNRRLHLGIRDAPVQSCELFAAKEQPRRGPSVASKRLRIDDRFAVEGEIFGELEVSVAMRKSPLVAR